VLNRHHLKSSHDTLIDNTTIQEVCGAEWFRASSLILFLNKYDIFREKLVSQSRQVRFRASNSRIVKQEHGISLTTCFPEYDGGLNVQVAANYVAKKFSSPEINKSNRRVYAHFTVATDTENVRMLLASIKDQILTQQFQNIGL